MTASGADLEEIRYSLIVPVYKNEATIPALMARIRGLAKRFVPLEAVLVVDGSPDQSAEMIREELGAGGLAAQLILLARNFGSFSAIQTGLAAARGEWVAVMAADLQEPESLVSEFFVSLAAGECDVAIGTRLQRSDPPLASLFSRLSWHIITRFAQPGMPRGGVDMFGCTRRVAQELASFRELHTSLIGLLFWLGNRRKEFTYERQPRPEGTSAWSFRRRLRYLGDSIFAFTDLPITILMLVGVLGLVLTVAAAVAILIARATGHIRTAGYTPLILAVLFGTSAILLALGIIGSYVWRTYENSKGRPTTVTMRHDFF